MQPNSIQVVAPSYVRQWRLVFKERALNKRAQWEIKGIFTKIMEHFGKLLPCVFGDLSSQIEASDDGSQPESP